MPRAEATAPLSESKIMNWVGFDGSHGIKIALKDIDYFIFLPLPNDPSPPVTTHVDLTSGLCTKGAIKYFGWTQLPLFHWLEYARSPAPQLFSSEGSGQALDVPSYRILHVLVEFVLMEGFQQWNEAAELMEGLKRVPINMELQLPAKSYFKVADICGSLSVADYVEFDDIPLTPVAVQRGFEYRPVERLRVANVQRWAGTIFHRLETVASGLSNYRPLRFLTTIRNGDLTEQDTLDLQTRRAFYSENHGQAPGAELYLSNEDVRKLGLPILALPQDAMMALQRLGSVDPSNPWQVEMAVESLGIRECPTLDKIIALAASDRLEVRRAAL
ncbi:hypothetical protein J3R82DRAFT_5095 [Butyriboletus roseoflavus]|nr:hypothetical protein J3R82DRAFT_5095 [Butyriboletus roseoflavus]